VLAAPSTAWATKATNPGADAHEALLTATVNGVADPTPLTVLTDASGRIYVASEQLAAWRLSVSGLPSIVHDSRRFYLLNAIDGAQVRVEQSTQELKLTVPTAVLKPTRLSYAKVEISDEVVGGTGAFVNYDVSGETSSGAIRGGAAIEAGLFTPYGVGISRFVGRAGGKDSGMVRLDSSWTVDDPAGMRSLRIGDSISSGGPGGRPVRFAGIQLARNFAVQPGFVTFPIPSLEGSADVPSVVDVYVNDVLTRSSDVPPGPFDIVDIPVVTGRGEVQLVVRDMLGRQRLVSESYYASSNLLRRGLDDYSYEIGFLRRSYGKRSNDYGTVLLSGTHRYGFSDHFTAAAHVEATPHVQAAGAGASLAIPALGEVDATVASSHSNRGQGYSAGFTLERRSRGFSFGVHTEWTSGEYMTVGASPDRRPPASIVHVFAGMPVGSGSLGLSYLRRDGRTEPDAEIASANWSIRLGGVGSVNLSARTNISGPRETAAELMLVMPLGFATGASASAGVRVDAGKPGFQTMLQKSVPVGTGLGYRFSASSGRFERVDGRVTVRTSFADYDAQLTWTDGNTGARVSTSGGIGILGGQAFVSRKLERSFARVEVGDYSGVRVYADNQLIGRTGSDGSIIVPTLRPYDRNAVRIEAGDLPLDAKVTEEQKVVRPYDRTGVVVNFGVEPSKSAYLKVILSDGRPLPTGSSIRLPGQSEEFVSAPGGEVYLSGVEGRTVAIAEWARGRCRFPVVPTHGASAAPAFEARCEMLQ
jgi:outer membrane usher protein